MLVFSFLTRIWGAMNKIVRSLLMLAALLPIAACSLIVNRDLQSPNQLDEFRDLQLETMVTAQACGNILTDTSAVVTGRLDASKLEVLSWNIKKGALDGWSVDLENLVESKQLILLQEAALSMNLAAVPNTPIYGSFSPGYTNSNDITGVVTFSEVEPISRCRLAAIEPWLGTPKSTNVAQFALSGSESTLVVVNTHAVNFSIGLKDYQSQLDEIATILAQHEGPIIFSGDFNTWRGGRHDVLMNLVAGLNLRALQYEPDHRKTVFGRPLDHVFIRGFEVLKSETYDIESSDHNPISFSLRMQD